MQAESGLIATALTDASFVSGFRAMRFLDGFNRCFLRASPGLLDGNETPASGIPSTFVSHINSFYINACSGLRGDAAKSIQRFHLCGRSETLGDESVDLQRTCVAKPRVVILRPSQNTRTYRPVIPRRVIGCASDFAPLFQRTCLTI